MHSNFSRPNTHHASLDEPFFVAAYLFRTLLLVMFWLARTWFVKYQTLDCRGSWRTILIPSIRLR